ncbi:MAG: membrane dipeptidase [Terrisporobacter sp.]|uniref:dipeptidase n=1 Tax=Terrisporobacter sp. TaxID=1965305 RepID=UPI002FC7C3B5
MIFDCHSDTFTDITLKRHKNERNIFKNYHLNNFKEGNVCGSIFVIWIDPPYDNNPSFRANQIVSALKDELEENNDVINVVKSFDDIGKGFVKSKVDIVIGMEGLSHIGNDIDRINYFYDEVHARHASLTWNEENILATGVLGDENRGLTSAGKSAVKRLEELHMIVDISHLNEKSFWDLMNTASRPVIASHSNAKSLCNVKRNLSDEQLKAIASSGGVVGLNGFSGFVSSNKEKQNLQGFVDHIDYMADLIGVDHICLGFDYCDYIDCDTLSSFSSDVTNPNVKNLQSASHSNNVTKELRKRGYRENDIDKITHRNIFRVMEDVLR